MLDMQKKKSLFLPDKTQRMVRRTLSKCFLILAGIILVGHAIFPHHHHLSTCKIVDTVVAHCHEHDYISLFSHSHHTGGKTPECVLEQTVIVRPTSIRFEPQVNTVKSFDGTLNYSFLFSDCLNNYDYTYTPLPAVFLHADYQISLYSGFFRATSLRGPPVA
jgi:hypothetical protein